MNAYRIFIALEKTSNDSVGIMSTDIELILDNTDSHLKEHFGAKAVIGEVCDGTYYLALYSDVERHMAISQALTEAYPEDTFPVLLLKDGRYVELRRIG